jgi:hypothetical protein
VRNRETGPAGPVILLVKLAIGTLTLVVLNLIGL